MIDCSKAPSWATEARWDEEDNCIRFTGNGRVTYGDGSESIDNLGAESWGKTIANAHLIAAAPEMHAMLKSISDDPSQTDVVAIRRILKKARGEL